MVSGKEQIDLRVHDTECIGFQHYQPERHNTTKISPSGTLGTIDLTMTPLLPTGELIRAPALLTGTEGFEPRLRFFKQGF